MTLFRYLDILGAQYLCPTCILPLASGYGPTHLSLLYFQQALLPTCIPWIRFLHAKFLKPTAHVAALAHGDAIHLAPEPIRPHLRGCPSREGPVRLEMPSEMEMWSICL